MPRGPGIMNLGIDIPPGAMVSACPGNTSNGADLLEIPAWCPLISIAPIVMLFRPSARFLYVCQFRNETVGAEFNVPALVSSWNPCVTWSLPDSPEAAGGSETTFHKTYAVS